uniref:Uncharacterized protein n=1 Tax=Aegilops tauschii subsp. strangulata TaxID=200361 RepID=A0A453GXE8_AEGTS
DMFPAPAEKASCSDDAPLREILKTDLLTFPESAAMDPRELDDAVDRIIREYDPATATPVAQGMVRFDDNRIMAAFYNAEGLVKIPTAAELAPTGVFPQGWLEARRQELDEEVQAHKRKEPHSMGVLLAKIRVDLLTKGYVDVPKLYLDYWREK